MSAASDLREAIATKYKAVVFDEWDYTDFLTNGLDSFIDSTLDAVIASLSVNQKGQFEDDAGHICWYLDDMVSVLQSAKTQKGEE